MALRKIGKWAGIGLSFMLGLELAMQVIVRYVLHQPPLFTFDPVVGWRPRSDISITRRNINGDQWTIRTNDSGIRGCADWDQNAAHRILVLGDSFAFGEGVNIEERFDSLLHEKHPDWSFVNLGVMGHGTDQQLLAGMKSMKQLKTGDAVVLLLCGNDVFDVLRKEASGRPKPWVSTENSALLWHEPEDGIWIRTRNHSYIVARLAAASEKPLSSYSQSEVKQGMAIVSALVENVLHPLATRGVHVVIAYHQLHFITDCNVKENDMRTWLAGMSALVGVSCIDLDTVLSNEYEIALLDGHWNPKGHGVVARTLEQELVKLLIEPEQHRGHPLEYEESPK